VGTLAGTILLAWLGGLLVISLRAARSASGVELIQTGGRPGALATAVSLGVTEAFPPAFLVLAGSSLGAGHAAGWLAVGAVVGRGLVAASLTPRTFRSGMTTVHQRLHMRFGAGARRLAAVAFLLARWLQVAVVTALGAGLVAHLIPVSPGVALCGLALIAGAVAVGGGLGGVIRSDAVHAVVAVMAVGVVGVGLATQVGGIRVVLIRGWEAGWFDATAPAWNATSPFTLGAGLVGGAAWSAAALATDPLFVQRLLATGSARRARWAILLSAVFALAATSAALNLGTALRAAGGGAGSGLDRWMTSFALAAPASLHGWVALGVAATTVGFLAASAVSSASMVLFDLPAPSADGVDPQLSAHRARGTTALVWAVGTIAGAVALGEPPYAAALRVTAVVYGVFLGVHALAALRLSDPMRGSPGSFLLEPLDAGLTFLLAVPTVVWMARTSTPPFPTLAWPWMVPLYAAFVFGLGLVIRNLRKAVHDPRI
jgi:Na+/proline symporter